MASGVEESSENRVKQWVETNDFTGEKPNKRPKGPHIVHLSTIGHLFDRSARAEIFVY